MGKKNKRQASGSQGGAGKNRSSKPASGWAKKPPKAAGSGATARPAPGKGKALKGLHSVKLLPPVYRTIAGRRIDSPLATLGFPEGASPTKEEVRRRAAELLSDAPAEQDPTRAEEILEARRWLTQDDAAMERLMGRIRLPDPEDCLDGYVRQDPGAPGGAPDPARAWTSQSRLAALMALYAMVEYELEETAAMGAATEVPTKTPADTAAEPPKESPKKASTEQKPPKDAPESESGEGPAQGLLFEP